jgi:uncharacterized protein
MQEAVRKIVERFKLNPHPEGGFFREMYRSPVSIDHPGIAAANSHRAAATHIYFLLTSGDFSAFHRVRASAEIWHLYAGGPLELHTIDAAQRYEQHLLTNDIERGQPAYVVPADCWQAARPAAGVNWAFCGCTVAPGFDFADFAMPPAQELLAAFPAHERIIRELTKR